jgi:hypothetical protein
MVWIVLAICLSLLIGGILFSQLELRIDSRVPELVASWAGFGKALLIYKEDDWQLEVRILFFHRRWTLVDLFVGKRRAKKVRKKNVETAKKKKPLKNLQRIIRVIRSFRVTKWQLAIDSGDYIKNAWMYPLNFIQGMKYHLNINFTDENFLAVTLKNSVWRMLHAWIK